MNLEDGKLYWVKDKKYHHVYLAVYDADWSRGGCFDLFGSDDIFHPDEFDVLGKVKLVVPDYAKETGYGS